MQVMESLKRRVDPNGVRNLIWRPQPPNRIEIQMPSSGDEKLSEEIKGLPRCDRFTTNHVALVLTGDFISHLHPIADDDNRFAIGARRHRAVALPITGGTGHRLTLGYHQGRGETQKS